MDELDKELLLEEKFTQEVSRIFPELQRKYGDIQMLFFYSNTERIYRALNGEIMGKRILDLGCGANRSQKSIRYRFEDKIIEGQDGRDFEPWVCRVLHEMGAKAVGIDIGDLEQEEFEHHLIDLLEPNALSEFPDKSFDVINMNSFANSPSFEKILCLPAGDIVKNNWLREIRRLLKDDGKFVFIKGYEDQFLLSYSFASDEQIRLIRRQLWGCLLPAMS